MPKFAANLTMMFNEVPFPERFFRAAKAGFKGVEFLFPYDHPPQEVAGWLQENRLVNALFNMPPGDWSAGERGLASLPGREAEFRASVSLLHGSGGWRVGVAGIGRQPLRDPGSPMPFKANAARRHHIPKQRRRITN